MVECRLAAALLAKHLGVSSQEAAAITTLKEIEPMIAASEHGPGLLGKEAAVKALLHEGAYMQDEVSAVLRGEACAVGEIDRWDPWYSLQVDQELCGVVFRRVVIPCTCDCTRGLA